MDGIADGAAIGRDVNEAVTSGWPVLFFGIAHTYTPTLSFARKLHVAVSWIRKWRKISKQAKKHSRNGFFPLLGCAFSNPIRCYKFIPISVFVLY